jgi:hypothetical protein
MILRLIILFLFTITVACTGGMKSNSSVSNSTSGVSNTPQPNPGPTGTTAPNGIFVPLHTYYISPNGKDSNSGTSPTAPWLSPNHPVACGDVIIAAAGTYDSGNFANGGNFGTVSNCPSTSGGIDSKGGIYFANLICAGPDIESCNIVGNGYTSTTVWLDKSNWAVTGFKSSNPNNVWGSCFSATPSGTYSIHHVAFINDWDENCPGDGTGGGGNPGDSSSSTDYLAIVGAISHNAAGGTSECYSGLSIGVPKNYDTAPGTHIFVAGVFAYNNINGTCGYNAGAPGGYSTASATVSSGNKIQITDPSGSSFQVGMPIVDLGSGVLPITSIIPAGTTITAISGTTVTISRNLAGTVTSGDNIQAALTTDGEGINFDTWNVNPYTGQTVVEQNLSWHNGSGGFEFNQATQPGLNIYVFANTSYGNLQDPYHYGYGGLTMTDLIINNVTSPMYIYNNIFQESLATMGGAANNSTLWTGDNGYASTGGSTATSITGNFFKGLMTSCPGGTVCDSDNDVAAYNGYRFGANTYASAGFANPSAIPTTATPNCTGYATTTACMIGTGVVAALTPSGAAAGAGYQPPKACTPDPYYPLWLKGAVGLSVSGSQLSYSNSGIITKPCQL